MKACLLQRQLGCQRQIASQGCLTGLLCAYCSFPFMIMYSSELIDSVALKQMVEIDIHEWHDNGCSIAPFRPCDELLKLCLTV